MIRLFLCILLVGALGSYSQPVESSNELAFIIDKTWNGESIPAEEAVTITLSGVPDSKSVTVVIESPFYNGINPDDESGGNPLHPLQYEDVSVHFVNNAGQYLSVNIGPFGHFGVFLQNGPNNTIEDSLPLNVEVSKTETDWVGRAMIPGNFFPPQVTKFNAFANHWKNGNQVVLSLYPAGGAAEQPNIHDLTLYETIDMSVLSSNHIANSLSKIWELALKGRLTYRIGQTWNGEAVLDLDRINIELRGGLGTDIVAYVEAPFYDNVKPDGEAGKPFINLWDYEVVQLVFLNDQDQYMEVEIGPHGHHLVLLFNGERNTIRHSLPLNVTTNMQGFRWSGEVTIPGDYFPPRVSKFNAYAIHTKDTTRKYLALYPTTDETATEPDLHDLTTFQPIDMVALNYDHQDHNLDLSEIWLSGIDGRAKHSASRQFRRIFAYSFAKQWNGSRTNFPSSKVTLQGFQGGVEINYTIPRTDNPLYPPESFVIVFENKNGEALKLQLFVNKRYTVHLLTDRDNKITERKFDLDYIVDDRNSKYFKGSVLVAPKYFPPHVTLLNMYTLFGFETKIAVVLKPVNIYSTIVFRPQMNNLQHFTDIDFDILVQSNTEYSDLWRELLNLPPLPATSDDQSKRDSQQSESETKVEVSKGEDDDQTNEDMKHETEVSISHHNLKQGSETPDKDDVKQEESIPEDEIIPLTELPFTHDVKSENTISKESDPGTTISPEEEILVKENVATEKSPITDMESTTEEDFDQAKEIKDFDTNDTPTRTDGEDEVTEAVGSDDTTVQETDKVDEESSKNDFSPESEPDKMKGDAIREENSPNDETNSSHVNTDQKESATTTQVPETDVVKAEEGTDNPETTTVVGNVEREESINDNSDLSKVDPTKEESDLTESPITEEEIIQPQEATTESESLDSEDMKSIFSILQKEQESSGTEDVKNLETEQRSDSDITENNEPQDQNPFNLPLHFLLDRRQKKEREQYQRRYEETKSDQNELPITFEITIKTEEPDNKVQNLFETDTLKGVTDLQGIPRDDPLLDELLGLTEDEDYDLELLPLPHEFCFMEGLVPDPNRCQVFYECVLGEGMWEVYNWRCKRGFRYDAVTVACVRGHC